MMMEIMIDAENKLLILKAQQENALYEARKLKKLDEVAYVRFASVYRQFSDINTFFEELSELLKKKNG